MCFHHKCLTLTIISEGWVEIISNRHYATNAVNRASLTRCLNQNVVSKAHVFSFVPPVTPHLNSFYCTGHLKHDLVRGPYPLYLKGLSRKWPLQRRAHTYAHTCSVISPAAGLWTSDPSVFRVNKLALWCIDPLERKRFSSAARMLIQA